MKKFVIEFCALCLALLCGMTALSQHVVAGAPAPDFELADQNGNLHSIEDYRGSWVALYFYPRDDTPDCTTEACAFRDNIFAFRDANCEILGVSLDSEESHKSFARAHGLPFPLLADSQGIVADAYDVKAEKYGMTIAKRQTFLIDPDGNIAKHYADVDPDSHAVEILEELRRLQQYQPGNHLSSAQTPVVHKH